MALLVIVVILINLFTVVPLLVSLNASNSSDEIPRIPQSDDETNINDSFLPNWKQLYRIDNNLNILPYHVLDKNLEAIKPLSFSEIPYVAWLLMNEELFMERKESNHTSLVLLTTYLHEKNLTWDELQRNTLSNKIIQILDQIPTTELVWMGLTLNVPLVRLGKGQVSFSYQTTNKSEKTNEFTINLRIILTNIITYLKDSRIHPDLKIVLAHPFYMNDSQNDSIITTSRDHLLLSWMLLDLSRDHPEENTISQFLSLTNKMLLHFTTVIGPQDNYRAILKEISLSKKNNTSRPTSNETILFDQLLAYLLLNRARHVTTDLNYLEETVEMFNFLINVFVTVNYTVHHSIDIKSLTTSSDQYLTHDQLWTTIILFLTGQAGIARNTFTSLKTFAYNESIDLIKSCLNCNEEEYLLSDQILIYFSNEDNASFLITPTLNESRTIVIPSTNTEEMIVSGVASSYDILTAMSLIISIILLDKIYHGTKRRKKPPVTRGNPTRTRVLSSQRTERQQTHG